MAKMHYLYKIENKLNGKIYIGVHSTEDINDEYLSSGWKLGILKNSEEI